MNGRELPATERKLPVESWGRIGGVRNVAEDMEPRRHRGGRPGGRVGASVSCRLQSGSFLTKPTGPAPGRDEKC